MPNSPEQKRVEVHKYSSMATGVPHIPNLEYAARSMPFDQFGRYHMIREAIDASRPLLGKPYLAVLDVGGYFPGREHPFLPLMLFLPHDHVIVLDLVDCSLPGYVRGDGKTIPFPDDHFDFVVSADTLEHIPDAEREAFWVELLRVARHGVILLAPFRSTEVEIAEKILFDYIRAELGIQQQQLLEHMTCGLPDLLFWVDWLRKRHLVVHTYPSGYLHSWIGMMLLKHMLLRLEPALEPQLDWYYNRCFSATERRLPSYRRLISAAKTADIGQAIDVALAPTILPPQEDASVDWSHALMSMILASGFRRSALEQQETLRRMQEQYRLEIARYDAAFRDLSERVQWLEAQNQALRHQLEAIQRGRLMRILNIFRK